MESHLQRALNCAHPKIWMCLLHMLANGKPVAPTGMAEALRIPVSNVKAALADFRDTMYDDDGSVVACGLSLIPTPHSFQMNGRNLFTWCALDTLMYPVALQQTAQVESLCPVTGLPVRLEVSPGGVTFLDPPEAVVSIVVPAAQGGCCSVRSTFCSQVYLIRSPEAADEWRSTHPEATILSVEEAWRLGREVITRRLVEK